MKNNENIGKLIKYYRIQKGLTQQELADKLGITWEMVSRYETGKSSPIHRLFEISKALQINPSELLQDSFISTRNSKISIPYISIKPNTGIIDITDTKDRYIAPLWIIDQYPESFAMSGKIVNIKAPKLENASILFINPVLKYNQNFKYYLYTYKNILYCDIKKTLPSSATILGYVIAIEARFI